MVEVEVSCFEHSHYLYSDGWFAMERYACRGYQLLYKFLKSDVVYRKVAGLHKCRKAVDDSVHVEYRLGIERGVVLRSYRLQYLEQPSEYSFVALTALEKHRQIIVDSQILIFRKHVPVFFQLLQQLQTLLRKVCCKGMRQHLPDE